MSALPPEALLWNFLRGALMTKVLAIVADLGVADALAEGPRAVENLAREASADPDSLRRFLRALASDGVFEETEPGVFQHTAASKLLHRAGSWHDFAHLFGGVWYRAVDDLDATRPEAVFPRTFGTDFWAWLADHPDERASFDRAMAGGTERSVDRLDALEWRGDETVVDVGGGNGALLVGLLERRPTLRGIVFDLPETNRDEEALGERIEFVAGSFFESVPAGDVYVLSTILHDWDDEHATAILRTIRAAAPTRGRLLVLDAVVPSGNEPNGAKWLDLLMLVLANGRERTEAEWHALVESTRFGIDEIADGLIQASCR